jgi:hypothetical protein
VYKAHSAPPSLPGHGSRRHDCSVPCCRVLLQPRLFPMLPSIALYPTPHSPTNQPNSQSCLVSILPATSRPS